MSGMAGVDIAARTMLLVPEDRFARVCCENACLKEPWCWFRNEVKRCGCRDRPCAVMELPQRTVFAVIVKSARLSDEAMMIEYDASSQFN